MGLAAPGAPLVARMAGDRCGACGDPLKVCPSTVRVFVRCCGRCTHRGPLDKAHAKLVADLAAQAERLRAEGRSTRRDR